MADRLRDEWNQSLKGRDKALRTPDSKKFKERTVSQAKADSEQDREAASTASSGVATGKNKGKAQGAKDAAAMVHPASMSDRRVNAARSALRKHSEDK